MRGRFAFKCPPPGAWAPNEHCRELWGAVGGLDGGTYENGFDLELTHDTMHHTPGAEGVSMAAVHGWEYHGSGHGNLFALGTLTRLT